MWNYPSPVAAFLLAIIAFPALLIYHLWVPAAILAVVVAFILWLFYQYR